MMKFLLLAVISHGLSCVAKANDQMRDWTLTSGKSQQAEILAYDEAKKTVTLRHPDQSEVQYPEQDFSTIDRAWILEWVERDEEARRLLGKLGGKVTEHSGTGKFSVPYAVYHPPTAAARATLPLLILFHPGGNGRREIYKHIEAAAAVGITVVSLDYFRNADYDPDKDKEMLECFEELLPQIEATVPHDGQKVFMGGVSGGAFRAYHYSAKVARPWAGIVSYVGWLGGRAYYHLPFPRMRVAMVNGDKDKGAIAYIEADSARLQQDGSVVSVHAFEGGHQLAPPSVQEKALRWLLNGDSRVESAGGDKPAAGRTPAATATHDEIERFRHEALQLFRHRKFAELEAIANDVRSAEAKFSNASWKIAEFYGSFRGNRADSEQKWEANEKLFNDWIARFPKSITARVAYAEYWIDYAWKARGSGYASKVTPEQWKLFHERLAKAHAILDESRSLGSCPAWWVKRIHVALGEGEDPEACEKIFLEAKKLYPKYHRIDVQYHIYLLPRWYGEPGNWEAVAEREIDRPGGLGLAAYAKIVDSMSSFYSNIFKGSEVSWEKTQDGCELLRAEYPASKDILNTYCRLAILAEDFPTARLLLDEIGDDVVREVWGSIEKFNKLRNQALERK